MAGWNKEVVSRDGEVTSEQACGFMALASVSEGLMVPDHSAAHVGQPER